MRKPIRKQARVQPTPFPRLYIAGHSKPQGDEFEATWLLDRLANQPIPWAGSHG